MNIGVSLSPSFLCGVSSSAHQEKMLEGGLQPFLARLKAAGCTHIELRAIRRNTPEEIVRGAVAAVRQAGLSMTVHGALTDEEACDFWNRLLPVYEAQKNLCVTVHSSATREETVRLLRRLGEYASIHYPGAYLALENNRSKKGDTIDLVECGGVSKTLGLLNLPNIGACWDFGHFYWDRLAHPALLPDALPPADFLRRAVHTHIHSVFADTTHFPLTMGELPLAAFIGALRSAGYPGVYNLEPEPERWDESIDAAEEIIRSVQILKSMLTAEKED